MRHPLNLEPIMMVASDFINSRCCSSVTIVTYIAFIEDNTHTESTQSFNKIPLTFF